jgi:polypeptide N-acetylgalactosaminyltransferase
MFRFMKNVAYDVPRSFPLLPDNDVWGEAKNVATGKCIDTLGNPVPGRIGASSCHGYGGNQMFRLNTAGQLTQGEWCIRNYGGVMKTNHCVKGTINGPYKYDRVTI